MIVSHAKRYIFFAVPKTATQAIRQQLATQLTADDWQQHALYGRQVLPIQELAELGHGHISVRQAERYLSQDILGDYYRFAFVRHPFDRFVSATTFLFGDQADFRRNPIQMMKLALGRERFRERILIKPQFDLLRTEGGEIGVDFVGRYENLAADFSTVCERVGLPVMTLKHLNTSTRGSYEQYLDDALCEQLMKFYRQDFEKFSYQLP